ncbi:MAG: 50S ribosomal protein L22 [Parcubacteria group bacterium]
MRVNAKLNKIRIAPRKIKLVTDFIEGLDVARALEQLDATVKTGVQPIEKLLQSAISNGENNFGIDRDNMYVYKITVGAGPALKRWMPKAFGRAGRILKRTSQIELILEERVEGKGRKTKEQMEKEKKAREAKKKKIEKEAEEKRAEEKKPASTRDDDRSSTRGGEEKEKKELTKKVEKKGGLTSRIFRRKSM